MSGSTGAERIKSRKDFDQFVKSYTQLISKFPGFEGLKPSGSYNSNKSKETFGDIDLIITIKGDDKVKIKKDLAEFLSKFPDTVIVPFSSPKYKGKKFLNTGEIVTVRYHDPHLGYSVQIDNIIAIDKKEAHFKQQFLDYPAEKQGLILGLVKVAAIEEPIKSIFARMGIHAPITLPEDEEYEFNLSSIELQLRRVKYEKGSFKQLSRDVIWSTKDFNLVERLLNKYNLDDSFEGLINQAKTHLKNPRSNARMRGVFSSMISVKSGEVGTEKGANKEAALKKVNTVFGESKGLLTFREYLNVFN